MTYLAPDEASHNNNNNNSDHRLHSFNPKPLSAVCSLQTKQTQSLGMARPVQLVWSVILLLCCAAAASASASSFDDSNPIRLVSSDGLRDFETSVLQVIGQARHALSFARFARRYGKIYESVEEMKLRFATFSKNLDLIRSTNCKGLSYRLGLNSKFFILNNGL